MSLGFGVQDLGLGVSGERCLVQCLRFRGHPHPQVFREKALRRSPKPYISSKPVSRNPKPRLEARSPEAGSPEQSLTLNPKPQP